MNSRAIRLLGLGLFMCSLAWPSAAAPAPGKISGVVFDPSGTPQLGAGVFIEPEQLLDSSEVHILTNDRGRFSTAALPPGMYSIKVTLSGFMPATEQHIQVSSERTTVLEIVLGSVFSSFEKLRRQPDQQVAADDWTWVLRSSSGSRSVLQWGNGQVIVLGQSGPQTPEGQASHARLVLSSGPDRPGSVADMGQEPATSFVYDIGIGSQSQLLMAGQFSDAGGFSTGSLASEWLPSGKPGTGPVTTLVVRESRVRMGSTNFSGLRMAHEDQMALNSRTSVRYGAEYVFASLGSSSSALRPRGQVAVQLSRTWKGSAIVATHPWEDGAGAQTSEDSTLHALDTFPTVLLNHGRPVVEGGLHEELGIEHALTQNATVSAAVYHDDSSHTAVIGHGGATDAADFLQGYFSEAFAYDGGGLHSNGARLVYKQNVTENLQTVLVYAYAGVLVPNGSSHEATIRDQLAAQYRQSFAARASITIPRLGTRLSSGYKWLSGSTASQQDAYGEAFYNLDPYLSAQIRQPLPAFFSTHLELQADAGNLLAQGYVPMSTAHGQVVLTPGCRFIQGGLSFQF